MGSSVWDDEKNSVDCHRNHDYSGLVDMKTRVVVAIAAARARCWIVGSGLGCVLGRRWSVPLSRCRLQRVDHDV
jgi:hypothetical protein